MMWEHSSAANSLHEEVEPAACLQREAPTAATGTPRPECPRAPVPGGSRAHSQPQPVTLPPWQLVRKMQTTTPAAKRTAGFPAKERGSPSSGWTEADLPTPDRKKAKTETLAGPETHQVAPAYGAKKYTGPPISKRLKTLPVGSPPEAGPGVSYKFASEMVTWTTSKDGTMAICAVTYCERCENTFKNSKSVLNTLAGPLQSLDNY